MILMNHKGTAVHPFPAPVCIMKRAQLEKDGKTTHPYNAIMCGDNANFMIAAYHDLAPAKMEFQRMLDVYGENPNAVFTFMRDPYQEENE